MTGVVEDDGHRDGDGDGCVQVHQVVHALLHLNINHHIEELVHVLLLHLGQVVRGVDRGCVGGVEDQAGVGVLHRVHHKPAFKVLCNWPQHAKTLAKCQYTTW